MVIAVKGDSLDKTIGGMEEIRARKGRVIAVTNVQDERITRIAEDVILVPETREALSPLLTVIPLQLLAYYIAVELERNVDQPRNLAKSVTVEISGVYAANGRTRLASAGSHFHSLPPSESGRREHDVEGASPAQSFALRPDPAAVQLDKAPAEGKPQPRAFRPLSAATSPCSNGRKMRSRFACSIPRPVSETAISKTAAELPWSRTVPGL